MASLNGTFDATAVQPAQAFSVIPAGKYKVQVVDSDMRATKDGNGQYLWLEMEILDGEFKGQKLWDRLNLVNQNTQAVEIAQRALSALCHATGKLHVSDSADLHFIPVTATVKVRPARENYDASNEVRGYEGAGNVAPVSRFPTTPQDHISRRPSAAPAAAAGAPTPPWKNRTTA
jgi:hypothetical protein